MIGARPNPDIPVHLIYSENRKTMKLLVVDENTDASDCLRNRHLSNAIRDVVHRKFNQNCSWLASFAAMRLGASLSLVEKRRLTSMSPMSTINGMVIEPVSGDLKLSNPRMKTMPEICPMSKSKPFDVPSGAGWVTSAPY